MNDSTELSPSEREQQLAKILGKQPQDVESSPELDKFKEQVQKGMVVEPTQPTEPTKVGYVTELQKNAKGSTFYEVIIGDFSRRFYTGPYGGTHGALKAAKKFLDDNQPTRAEVEAQKARKLMDKMDGHLKRLVGYHPDWTEALTRFNDDVQEDIQKMF